MTAAFPVPGFESDRFALGKLELRISPPRASHFLFARGSPPGAKEKVTKEKARPDIRSCAARMRMRMCVPARVCGGVRLSFIELVDRSGFALPGESLFSFARMAGPKKGTKNACPVVRPCAARRVPSLHRRSKGPWLGAPRQKGHPWPSAPFAASLRLTPLHDDSAQPDERGDSCGLRLSAGQGASFFVGWITAQPYPPDVLSVVLRGSAPLAAKLPLRPAERRRCAGGERPGWPREAGLGQGWPMPAGPRSGAGARGVRPRSGQTRMSGHAFSLVTFSLRGQRESNSARGPKPMLSGTARKGLTPWLQTAAVRGSLFP